MKNKFSILFLSLLSISSIDLFCSMGVVSSKKREVKVISEADISRLLGAIYFHEPLEKIKSLLDTGIDPNYSPNYKISFLTMALQVGNLEAAKLLIERGANVNWVNRNGVKPISFVPLNQGKLSVDLINLLLDNGAEINENDIFVLPLGAEENNSELVSLLRKHNVKLQFRRLDPLWSEIPYMEHTYIEHKNFDSGGQIPPQEKNKECNIL